MSALGHIAACATFLLVAVSLAACVDNDSSAKHVVARVGGEAITEATLAHWMTVLKGGRTASHLGASQEQALRKQALRLLISRQWLINGAASRGISISQLRVRQQIDGIVKAGFPGGSGELREFLRSTGQTFSDFELQARSELALARLRKAAIDGAPAVTAAQVAAYYAGHRRSFFVPELREARYQDRKTRAAAEKIKREVEAGKSLTSPVERMAHEVFVSARVPPSSRYEKVLDSLKPNVVSGPFHLGADYWIFEVVRIIPAYQRTLAQVSGTIRKSLVSERRRRALANLAKRMTATWIARTDCKSGYVVQKCRQYTGPRVEENPLRAQ